MSFYKFLLLLLSSFFLFQCGKQDNISIKVDISSSQVGTNPLRAIAEDKKKNVSRGIFFQFHTMNCPPLNINDVVNSNQPSFSFPNLEAGEEGVDPLKDSYTIPTSDLNKNIYYRVTMIAVTKDNRTTHQGTGDCPFHIGLEKRNRTKICFGDASLSISCPGTTSFDSCPSSPCN